MRFATLVKQLSLTDVKAMIDGAPQFTLSDMDFLDTLAAHKCLIVTPWILRANPDGGLARVARLTYDLDGNIDKPRVLLAVAREFRRAKRLPGPLARPLHGCRSRFRHLPE
jgi:hypothetical protein